MWNRGWLPLIAGVLGVSVSARAAEGGPVARNVWISAPEAAGAVQRAMEGARRKLQNETCRAVLSDFTDVDGRPLPEKLDRLGLTAAEYLEFVILKGAEGGSPKAGSPCRNPGTLAFTTPGSRVVNLCTARFVASKRGFAENALIHELLHTLGLGEDPPSSSEITHRVRERCGY